MEKQILGSLQNVWASSLSFSTAFNNIFFISLALFGIDCLFYSVLTVLFFLASISALSSSSSNLKSYSVKNSSITQYRPGGQVEMFKSSLNKSSFTFSNKGIEICFYVPFFVWGKIYLLRPFQVSFSLMKKFYQTEPKNLQILHLLIFWMSKIWLKHKLLLMILKSPRMLMTKCLKKKTMLSPSPWCITRCSQLNYPAQTDRHSQTAPLRKLQVEGWDFCCWESDRQWIM